MAKIAVASTLLCTALGNASDPDWPQFKQFMSDYSKDYSTRLEQKQRFAIFKDNLKLIDQRNAKGTTMKHDVTKFADMTPAEFQGKLLGRTDGYWSAMTKKPKFTQTWEDVRGATESINWCDLGHCTPVKDQGHCGSCWAFDGTEMMESDFSIRFGELYTLSTQEATSCDPYDGGCQGGNSVNEWAWVNSVGGLAEASVYPYESGETECSGKCDTSLEASKYFKVNVEASYWFSQSAADEGNMLLDIALTPISVAVDASTWSSYTGGIVTAADCGSTSLNHNVQVVGYNADGNYWIVRNSWSSAWGNDGFINLAAGNNTCGIAMEASAVVTSKPASSVV